MHYVLAVRVHNHPGVLLRLVNLLYRRDVALRSMTADLAPDSPTGHVSLGVDVEEAQAAQVCKYLERLEDVICVEALQQDKNLCRELAILKVPKQAATARWLQRGQVRLLAETQDACWVMEVTGSVEEVNGWILEAESWGLRESRRTGPASWQQETGA